MTENRQMHGGVIDLNGGNTRFLVIYDGACQICKISVDFLKRVDVLNEYSYQTLQEYSKQPGSKIPFEFLQESIHVIDKKIRKTHSGMKGISVLLFHSPPSFPLYLMVMLLRLMSIADPLYSWISSSRYVLSRHFSHQ